MNLTQKISKKLNYDVDQFSKKYEQHVKEFEKIVTQNDNTLNELFKSAIDLKYQIIDLKRHERELIEQKKKIEKSNSTDIQEQIYTLNSEISQINIQLEHARELKQDISVKIHELNADLPQQTSELYKLKNELKNKTLKKKAAIFLENKSIKSQKDKDEKRFKELHQYNSKYIPDYEDLSDNEFEKYNIAHPNNYVTLPTLLHVFESISTNIENGFKSNIFTNKQSNHTYTIIRDLLEIRLNLELELDNHDTLIKIRIRKPQSKNSVIRMLHSKKQKDTMIIERVNTIDNEIPVSCSLYLAFLLCTFWKIRVIELFDNNDRKSKYDQYMSTGKPVGITKDIIYSHDLSYYNDYGFQDKLYNKYEPLFHNCNGNEIENDKYCERNESVVHGITFSNVPNVPNVPPITFILMIRNFKSTYLDNILKHKLSQIVLSELQSLQDLCLKLPCFKDVFDLPDECTDTGTFTSIVNYYNNKTTKFGYSTNSYHMFPFPYSANF